MNISVLKMNLRAFDGFWLKFSVFQNFTALDCIFQYLLKINRIDFLRQSLHRTTQCTKTLTKNYFYRNALTLIFNDNFQNIKYIHIYTKAGNHHRASSFGCCSSVIDEKMFSFFVYKKLLLLAAINLLEIYNEKVGLLCLVYNILLIS